MIKNKMKRLMLHPWFMVIIMLTISAQLLFQGVAREDALLTLLGISALSWLGYQIRHEYTSHAKGRRND